MSRRPSARALLAAFALVVALALSHPSPAAADLDGAAIQAHVTRNAPLLAQRMGRPLPKLTAADWERVATGKPVKKRFNVEGSSVQVASITQALRLKPLDLWLTFADVDHDEEFMPDVAEAVALESRPDGTTVQYGYLDLPPLVSDRHWVVDFRPNPALYKVSEGKVWEWTYVLRPDARGRIQAALNAGRIARLTRKQVEGAILVASSEGGWTLQPLSDGRTLVTYQVMSDIGGTVPDSIVTRLATGTLVDLLRVVAARAPGIYGHYNAAHASVPGPDGAPVPKR